VSDTFESRFFDASQAVYDRIVNGDVVDVTAELMQAHHDASTPDADEDN
jgi:hypothetical protein